MLIINFGKWYHKATSLFLYTRVLKDGYKRITDDLVVIPAEEE